MLKKLFIPILIILLSLVPNISKASTLSPDETKLLEYAKSIPEYQVTDQNVNQLEPAILTMYGVRLFAEGKKDEAVFWYWLSILRQQMLDLPEDRSIMLSEDMIIRLYREGGYIGTLSIKSSQRVDKGTTNLEKQEFRLSLEVPNRYVLYKFSSSLDMAYLKRYETDDVDNFISIIERVIQYEKEHPFDPTKLTGAPRSSWSGEVWEKKRLDSLGFLTNFSQILTKSKDEINDQRRKDENFFGPIFKIQIDPKTKKIIITPEEDLYYFLVTA